MDKNDKQYEEVFKMFEKFMGEKKCTIDPKRCEEIMEQIAFSMANYADYCEEEVLYHVLGFSEGTYWHIYEFVKWYLKEVKENQQHYRIFDMTGDALHKQIAPDMDMYGYYFFNAKKEEKLQKLKKRGH